MYNNNYRGGNGDGRDHRHFTPRDNNGFSGGRVRRRFSTAPTSGDGGEHRPYHRPYNNNGADGERRPYRPYNGGGTQRPRRPFRRPEEFHRPIQPHYDVASTDEPMRLNRFIANSGMCSRREADDFIKAGVVKVNGVTVTEMGVRVKPTDEVLFHDQPIRGEQKVYILLNKPKDTITTLDDEKGRQSVLDIIKDACTERVYPVGRLDRNTTGVLLLTNDGELATKLTHPKFEKKKVYQVVIREDLRPEQEKMLRDGVTLEDGFIKPDAVEFTREGSRRYIGIEIHSGKNRVVRRIFEQLGCKVVALDRVSFAGLTKKDVPRGKYRFLTPEEVNMLKMGAFE